MKELQKNLNLYKDKIVIITGGNGYIGSSLTKKIEPYAREILITSRSRAKVNESNLEVITTDLMDSSSWEEIVNRSDIIFHLAGNTSVYKADKDPFLNLKQAILPLENLRKALIKYPKDIRLVFASTATVYGVNPPLPTSERQFASPVTIYDLHKIYAEEYLQFLNYSSSLNSLSLRLSNVYGPSNNPSSSIDRGVLNQITDRLRKGEKITLYGGGKYLRDYIFIEDLVDAFVRAGIQSQNKFNCFNICSGESITLRDAFLLVAKELKVSSENIVDSDWPKDINMIEKRNFKGSNKLFKKEFLWKPKTSFQAGIQKLINL